jgi:hypothetical protein
MLLSLDSLRKTDERKMNLSARLLERRQDAGVGNQRLLPQGNIAETRVGQERLQWSVNFAMVERGN